MSPPRCGYWLAQYHSGLSTDICLLYYVHLCFASALGIVIDLESVRLDDRDMKPPPVHLHCTTVIIMHDSE